MSNSRRKGKQVTAYQVFSVINILFMILIIFLMAYPVYYIVMASFSDPGALSKNSGLLWAPLKPFTLRAYKQVFKYPLVISGFRNTFFVLSVGISVNLVLTVLGAFFLAVKGPMLKKPITLMIIFTMYFSGGMIPSYLNIRDLGMIDSLWALIFPVALNTTNLIIMKTAFQSIPDSLIESAQLDGASYLQILIKIMIPLSKATIAVMVLYYGVAHWNSWFNASIYLQSNEKFPLQLVMNNIIKMTNSIAGAGMDEMAQLAESIKYALIVVGTAPILILYPFLQKYFVKGVMIGAVKG